MIAVLASFFLLVSSVARAAVFEDGVIVMRRGSSFTCVGNAAVLCPLIGTVTCSMMSLAENPEEQTMHCAIEEPPREELTAFVEREEVKKLGELTSLTTSIKDFACSPLYGKPGQHYCVPQVDIDGVWILPPPQREKTLSQRVAEWFFARMFDALWLYGITVFKILSIMM